MDFSQKANGDVHLEDNKEKEVLREGLGLKLRQGPLTWELISRVLSPQTLSCVKNINTLCSDVTKPSLYNIYIRSNQDVIQKHLTHKEPEKCEIFSKEWGVNRCQL